MSKRFVTGYSIFAFLVLLFSIALFSVTVYSELQKGAGEADLSFSWITRSTSLSAVTDGFMSDQFVGKLTDTCRKSRSLVAFMITTPSGVAYAWPDRSGQISYTANGEAVLTGSSLFMRTFSTELDIPGHSGPPVVATAVMYILHPSAIFTASRLSFLITLALILITLIVILAYSPGKNGSTPVATSYEMPDTLPETARGPDADELARVTVPPFDDTAADDDFGFPFDEPGSGYDEPDNGYNEPENGYDEPDTGYDDTDIHEHNGEAFQDIEPDHIPDSAPADISDTIDDQRPEGLYSPATGVGWEEYLKERLDAELVRAASSEQDLSLMVVRISGTKHTDLVSRKIAQAFLELIKFRDMVFEFGVDGFAGIFQNVTLDQAMKLADELYENIDALLMESGYESQITIGITTRTARLISADRMLDEAVAAATKAVAEPDLPIVAFRANPDKYRDFVAGNL
jgi:GGDEF domain-containing protein